MDDHLAARQAGVVCIEGNRHTAAEGPSSWSQGVWSAVYRTGAAISGEELRPAIAYGDAGETSSARGSARVVVRRLTQAGQRHAVRRAAQVLHEKDQKADQPTDAHADVARRRRI